MKSQNLPEAKKRLESCGGKEAGWVTAIPSRPEYRLTSQQWRDRFAARLGLMMMAMIMVL